VLDWEHVDLDIGGGELAGDEAGRKPGRARVLFDKFLVERANDDTAPALALAERSSLSIRP
jgi:hypothetical protein